MTVTLNEQDHAESQKLAALVRTLNSTGHNPATSGNYSLRSKTLSEFSLVSESGIDKSQFSSDNFLPVNYQTHELHSSFKSSGRKSSDETAIHLAIYQTTSAQCVLHSHLLEALLFADLFPSQDVITIQGLELLKGFKGIKTHETAVKIPCFENTQDIVNFAPQLKTIIESLSPVYGFILRHHGLYVWGESVSDAKRHLEVFEYIFKYYLSKRGM